MRRRFESWVGAVVIAWKKNMRRKAVHRPVERGCGQPSASLRGQAFSREVRRLAYWLITICDELDNVNVTPDSGNNG